MDQSKFNLMAALSAMAAGLLAAVICFGLLRSTATGTLQGLGFSVGGALAGALAAAWLTHKFFVELQTSSQSLDLLREQHNTELRDLRTKNEELRRKVIRGAPSPEGFVTEVDERQNLVVARPKEWEPIGANIFAFQCPDDQLRPHDVFAPRMRVTYYPMGPPEEDRDAFYQLLQNNFEMGAGRDGGPYRFETITVGSERLESLKFVARTYVRMTVQVDPLTNAQDRSWVEVTQAQFGAHVASEVERIVSEAQANTALGWDELVPFRNRVNSIKEIAETELEHGRLEFHGLEAFVRAALADPKEANDGPRSDEEASQVSAMSGASALDDTHPQVRHTVEVLPIARVTVCCHHRQLGKIFFFDFEDNAADFGKSSATFNKIINSARFLA